MLQTMDVIMARVEALQEPLRTTQVGLQISALQQYATML